MSREKVNKKYIFTRSRFLNKKLLFGSLGVLTGGCGVLILTSNESLRASIMELQPARYPWDHYGLITALDHASIRRGYEVYKQACASCHSLRHLAYRNLVDVTHTEAEAKAEAEEQMVEDGPDEEGNMYERPGKLSDYFPSPYPNDKAARAANNGASPPDLSHIILSKFDHEDYIFSLLTGYCEAPAGVVLREGQYYNPYFVGGALSMGPPLFDDSVNYSDGTASYVSQMAKDVTVFLKWAGEPEFDDRQRMMVKMLIICSALMGVSFYLVRMKWMPLKSRKIEYRPKKYG
ncbi:cytochrome c1, heme protein, mitochondrial-like [Diorhabda sublineata]|uniref:cytochrome c1, heme protein, mitochondrial-like n=1 Tax=Diorhabda sublineata TaxID=1163346 RepID=UPI0024E1783C|nr:cytochrome c1, heme protein, mitochondrial-like [Diorhabda sublineata]